MPVDAEAFGCGASGRLPLCGRPAPGQSLTFEARSERLLTDSKPTKDCTSECARTGILGALRLRPLRAHFGITFAPSPPESRLRR